VVQEECYALPPDFDGVPAVLANDPLLREYIAMSPSDQRNYLVFLDHFANIIVGALPQMNLPLQFKTAQDWQAIFTHQGFVVTQALLTGFRPAYFHRSCHVWFVLDAR
jgi:hypothetical protein